VSATGLLTGFIEELRAVGIPVSMVEAIDAASALRHVDLGDRRRVKATLGATLGKHARHADAFETAFEIFFGLRTPPPHVEEQREAVDRAVIGGAGAGSGGDFDPDDLVRALFAALRDEDRPLLMAVVRQAVRHLSGMEPGRPVGGTYYLYRILRELNLEELEARLLEMGRGQQVLTALEERLLREELRTRIEEFREELRSEIRRRLVADRGARAVARTLRRPLLEDVDLTTATRQELAEIERIIHPLTRKLAVRLAQRRRRGRIGRLDVRRTIRTSLSTGGVPVDPRFRRPRPGKPEIIVLADISGSMSTFARFTLQVVYSMAAEFSRVRAFAFIDAIDEVTGFFGPGTEFSEALARISTEARVVWLDGHSDYGNALGRFADDYLEVVTPRSTVIVAGDARNNYHDANVPAARRIAATARALFWINPEQRRYWDTGDSVIGSYEPVCDGVFEVRNLRQLAAFVERVAIPVTRPVRRIA
jgi:uncharacterized protein with von Willebrand factor type A (vWA) domain